MFQAMTCLVLLGILVSGCQASVECEVLKHPASFNGKRVDVEAVLLWSREGSALSFPDCPEALRTGEYYWKTQMWIGGSRLPSEPTGLASRFAELVKLFEPELIADRIRMTVRAEVLIKSKDRYEVREGYGGRSYPLGFGHLREYVVEAAITEIHSISIIDTVSAPN